MEGGCWVSGEGALCVGVVRCGVWEDEVLEVWI